MSTDRIFHRTLKDHWLRISHGEGVYLYDEEGQAWLDACAGVHVVSIGHAVPEVVAAMEAQASKVCFTYSRFLTQPQIDLAERIGALAPGDLNRVFFVSGGSEATESAMKIARKYHVERGNTSKHRIVSRWQSWHGNTVGALSMSGRSPWRKDFEPYLLDFPKIRPCDPYRCPYCADEGACNLTCADDLARVIQQEGADSIAAFIAEPILGTSCCGLTPPPEYFARIRDICDQHDILMIVDEVVTGFGRTGCNFGIEHFGVVPDIMATGKGLSSGYTPIAATIVRDEVYDAIYHKQGSFVHGHTYGGNPLSCAVALAVQDYIAAHDLVDNCRRMGERMLAGLQPLLDNPIVGAVRGKGLLTGVEFVADKTTREPFPVEQGVTTAVVDRVFAQNVLIMPGAPGLVDGVAGDHIAISPPFTVNEEQVDETIQAVTTAVQDTAHALGK
ncbi:MAG: aminotransferase class III-fold pyridoxal phosphate-dependent enzyme [Gemmatimonadetes bacterium]|jgi:adenosylmethionine-8-amino-7-oxononanoate aminotransferase|nr:aminotransferase class III-fold pyridoxal phosphate-dependent enzyme [Gemmatimonadota bacterium]MBT6147318.1 aminotransferase class III-fold pyridoxal phosphate-dependent enzyme [Gemmatimonadota bacterium]MBT7861288.1 aminotransferase class III-fold pyridoxal phosphate-dependent enzyme [Gemmatimonadota bacterium]